MSMDNISTKEYIYSVDDLLAIQSKLEARDENGKPYEYHFKLMTDLDLDGEVWKAIGTPAKPFLGWFDGNGHSISNLTLNPEDPDAGLFGRIERSVIENIHLKNVNITKAPSMAGGIAGRAYYSHIKDSSVVGGKIESTTSTSHTGGIVGHTSNTTLERNMTDITLIGSRNVGAIVGRGTSSTIIRDSYSLSTLFGWEAAFGSLDFTCTIENSYFAGNVSSGYIGLGGPNRQNNYYNIDIQAGSTNADDIPTARTTEEMYQQATFVDWDFENIWEIEEGEDYPRLRWERGDIIPQKTYKWPIKSGEVTLWYGENSINNDDFHDGIDIQSSEKEPVVSIVDGIISDISYDNYYDYMVSIDFSFKGKNMRLQFNHISDVAHLNVGDTIQKNDIIGYMTYKEYAYLVEVRLFEENIDNYELIDPMHILEQPPYDLTYMTRKMETSIGKGYANLFSNENDANTRYRKNLDLIEASKATEGITTFKKEDLQAGEVYLRKEILRYAKKETGKGFMRAKDLEKLGFITHQQYDDYFVVTIHLNNKEVSYLSSSLKIKNGEAIINQEQLWRDIYGNSYYAPDGGTWVANPDDLDPTFYRQDRMIIYIPYDEIRQFQGETEKKELLDSLISTADELLAGASAVRVQVALAAQGINLPITIIVAALYIIDGENDKLARDQFIDAIEAVTENDMLIITETFFYNDYTSGHTEGPSYGYEIVPFSSYLSDPPFHRGTFIYGEYFKSKDFPS